MEKFVTHGLIEEAVWVIFYVFTRLPDHWAIFVIPILMLGGLIFGFLPGRKSL
jgi:hypothetical protein